MNDLPVLRYTQLNTAAPKPTLSVDWRLGVDNFSSKTSAHLDQKARERKDRSGFRFGAFIGQNRQ